MHPPAAPVTARPDAATRRIRALGVARALAVTLLALIAVTVTGLLANEVLVEKREHPDEAVALPPGISALLVAAALTTVAVAALWLLLVRARRRQRDALEDALAAESALREAATAVAREDDLDRALEAVSAAAAAAVHATSAVVLRAGLPVPAADAATHVQVPVRVAGAGWGTLVVSCSLGGLPADAPARLAPYAELAGIAVGNAAALARLADLAATDPLTGLASHRAFQERLVGEARRATRHGRPLALVVLGIDHFRGANDALGHRGGDRLLVELAARMRECSRAGDVVARLGGDEFGWLMPDCDSWGAWCAAERLRGVLAGAPLSGLSALTVSAGVCGLEQAEGDPDRLFQYAGGALYWAKEHGRDLTARYSAEVVVDLSPAERADRLERRRTLDAVRLLAQAVDARDSGTRAHSERVARLAGELARELGWPSDRIEALREAALVHDVGKIGIPDSVLLKEGPLTDEERVIIRGHAVMGATMVSDVLSAEQVSWVRGHHERWDGHGYPDGLAGEEIPSGAQVLIVADAFDAMSANRPYRPGRPITEAYREVLDGGGAQFPPEVVDALTRLMATGRFADILSPATPGGAR